MPRATLALLALAAPCLAQEPPPPDNATAPESAPHRPITWYLSARGDLSTVAELSGSPGDVTISRVNTRLGADFPAGQRGTFSLGYQYEVSGYSFDNASGLIPGTSDPWDTVHRHSLGVRYARQANAEWSWVVGSTLTWAAEEGGDLADGLTAAAFGAVRYALSESVTVGLGLQYLSRLEDSDLFLPFPSLDWRISDEWRLTTDREQGRGVGLGLVYTPTEQWTFSVGGGYEYREFRLDESGPLPDGVVRDSSFPVSLTAAYTPNRNMSLAVEVGAALGQTFRILDTTGAEISEPDVDPTLFLALQFGLSF